MIDKNELEYLMMIKTAKQIAKDKKCSVSNVYVLCRKYNIKKAKTNLVGKKYAQLEVIERIGSKNGQIYWKVKCSCGKILEKPTKSITREEQKTCGCIFKTDNFKYKNKMWNGYGEIHGKWFHHCMRGAVKRNLQFSITIEEVWALYLKQNKKCALTGRDIWFAKTSRGFQRGETTVSIDRIDSTLGYISSNIQLLHKDVNLAKQSLSVEDFIKLCSEVANYKQSKGK